jgi:tetratricopeptide (TPR) repeat protein
MDGPFRGADPDKLLRTAIMPPDIDLLLTSNPRDAEFVRRIADRVRERDFIPWTDRDGEKQASLAAPMAPAAAVCLGAHGLDPWERPVVRDCLQQMMKEGRPVVPILLPGAPEEPEHEMFRFIRDEAWVDFRAGLDTDEIDRLIWLSQGLLPCRGDREEPAKAPPDLAGSAFDNLGPTAIAILRLAAFLAPAPVPLDLFEESETIVLRAAGLLQEESAPTSLVKSVLQSFGLAARRDDPEPVAWAFADLADGSFVTGGEERTFTVSPQILDAVRSRIPEDQRWPWTELALQLVRDSSSLTTDRRTTPAFRLHVASVLAYAEGTGIHSGIDSLRRFLGDCLDAEGRVEEAEALLRRAVDLDQSAAGIKRSEAIWDLRALAGLLQSTGRAAEAEPLLRRAMTLAESGSDNEILFADTLLGLGVLLLDLDRPAEAEHCLRRAMRIKERLERPELSHLGASLRLLALAIVEAETSEEDRPEEVDGEEENDEDYEDDEDDEEIDGEAMEPLGEAEWLAARALALAEAMEIPDDLEIAFCLGTQAAVLQAQGRWDEAEPLLARSSELLGRNSEPGYEMAQRGRRWLEKIRRKQRARNASKIP